MRTAERKHYFAQWAQIKSKEILAGIENGHK